MAHKKNKGLIFIASLLMVAFLSPVSAYAQKQGSALNPTTPAEPFAGSEMLPTAEAIKPESQAQATEIATSPVKESDPLEKYNRVMFHINDGLDHLILKPVATFYNMIMPKPLNEGVHNFFNNIWEVTSVVNDLLQFNFYQALSDSWRFGINTTLGVGGIFDVAARMGLPQFNNDFGLTLASWGWEDSTFIVWPLFGPSTIRDGIEIPVDYYYFSLYPYVQPPSVAWQLYFLNVVDKRAQMLKFQNVLEEASFDKYVFVRNAYLQRRSFQIKQVNHLGVEDRTLAPLPYRKRTGWPDNYS